MDKKRPSIVVVADSNVATFRCKCTKATPTQPGSGQELQRYTNTAHTESGAQTIETACGSTVFSTNGQSIVVMIGATLESVWLASEE